MPGAVAAPPLAAGVKESAALGFTGLVIERAEARSRLQWIVFFRFVIIIGCLVALGLRLGSVSFETSLKWAFWLLVTGAAVNVLNAIIIGMVRRPARWGFIQILFDIVLISVLIYLTGGVLSYFNVLYFAAILSAGGAVSGRSGLFFASLATVFLSIVSTVYFLANDYGAALPWVSPDLPKEVGKDFQFVLSYLLAQGIAFHSVALLSLLLERRARRSELFREAILRDISEGVIALDGRGRFLYINDEARKMMGFPPLIPVVGKHWDQIFRRAGDQALRDLLFGRKSAQQTVELDRGGTKILVNVKTSLLMDEAHQRVIAVLGDLTLHQRAAEAERRADQLEKVAEMAASMAHELRNPLTSIRGCVQEIGRLQPVDDDTRKLIEIVCRESDRLDRIISDFLGFTRMRSPRLETGDASVTVKEVAILLQKRVKSPKVLLEVDVAPSLPCRFDGEQLQQALMNIGVNAIQAVADEGKVNISAHRVGDGPPGQDETLLGRVGDGAVEIAFSDTGPGISLDDIEKIFTPFFTTKKSGTGLGLAITSRIIKGHGGRIHVSSKPGRGATFVVWLPPVEAPGPEKEIRESVYPRTER